MAVVVCTAKLHDSITQ